ncbi:MAG: hypothetical protein IT497_10990 [Ottowia sp.]|nr:hypothetical protein [Ottowia sp.]
MGSREIDKYKAMEKTLGEPFSLEYQEDVLKTRRNLLVIGGLCILVKRGGLTVSDHGSFSFFGIPLQGSDDLYRSFLLCLLFAALYLTSHFLWASVDAIKEYQLRQSATRTRYQTATMNNAVGIDAPVHPRQSTLYNWWLEEAGKIDYLPEQLQGL